MKAGVAEPGQRRRVAKSDADASGAYPAGVRGFKSHPPHHKSEEYQIMSKTDKFPDLSSVKRCPICGGELGTAYITSFKGFVGLKPYLTQNIPVLKCENCRIAIFSYDRKMALGEFMKRCIQCDKEIPLASEECQYCGERQEKEKNGG